MGFRFRKSFKLAKGVRMTVSKSGISTRIGGKGFSVSSGKRSTRMNVGIPGTGISYSTNLSGGKKRKNSSAQASYVHSYEPNKLVTFLLCLFLGYFGAHKFYLRRKGMGVLYLCTLGLLGVGWIVDTIRLYVSLFIDPTQEYTEEEKKKKLQLMLGIAGAFIVVCLIGGIIARNSEPTNQNHPSAPVAQTTSQVTEETTNKTKMFSYNYDFSKPNAEYFTYNATIDDFFTDYNEIAQYPISAESIKRGNIDIKANFSVNNCYVNLICTADGVDIRVDAYNNDDLYNAKPIVSDMIKVVAPEITEEQIEAMFNEGAELILENVTAKRIYKNSSKFDLSLKYGETKETEFTSTTVPETTTITTMETTTVSEITTNNITTKSKQTVFITNTGKKYHSNSNCNDGDYFPVTLDEALGLHLEPCERCIG